MKNLNRAWLNYFRHFLQEDTLRIRVHTQIAFSNSLCFLCFFPVWWQIIPVPIYAFVTITYTKLAWQTYPASKKFLGIFSANIEISFSFRNQGNLQLEQTKFPVFSLCFGNISKFPVFSLTENFFGHFPC